MIIYQFKNHKFGASNYYDNPEQLAEVLEGENIESITEDDFIEINVRKAVQQIENLNAGDSWRNQHLSVRCLDVSPKQFEKLSEYNGW